MCFGSEFDSGWGLMVCLGLLFVYIVFVLEVFTGWFVAVMVVLVVFGWLLLSGLVLINSVVVIRCVWILWFYLLLFWC